MTKNEFKAWFDGFCECMDGAPNEKQWERVKARVAEIDEKPIAYPVYVDRYVEPYRRYWNVPYWSSSSAGDLKGALTGCDLAVAFNRSKQFDSLPAMNDAGRAEYKAMLA